MNANILYQNMLNENESLYKSASLSVSVCVCLFVCLFVCSLTPPNPNELKFRGMISLRVQMVLGYKTSEFGKPFTGKPN